MSILNEGDPLSKESVLIAELYSRMGNNIDPIARTLQQPPGTSVEILDPRIPSIKFDFYPSHKVDFRRGYIARFIVQRHSYETDELPVDINSMQKSPPNFIETEADFVEQNKIWRIKTVTVWPENTNDNLQFLFNQEYEISSGSITKESSLTFLDRKEHKRVAVTNDKLLEMIVEFEKAKKEDIEIIPHRGINAGQVVTLMTLVRMRSGDFEFLRWCAKQLDETINDLSNRLSAGTLKYSTNKLKF